MIYLDNAATTKIIPAVWDAMYATENNAWYNANTLYTGGVTAAKQINQARQIIMEQLHGQDGTLIFTSGATQANHLIMDYKIRKLQHHLITTAGDHNSIYLYAKSLREQGYQVTEAPLQRNGLIDIPATVNLVTEQTALLMFSVVNSDVGTLQDVNALVTAVRKKNPRVHIHGDAAQAFMKFPLDVKKLDLDSVTICAHKIHGPKGIGALWLRHGLTLTELHGTLNNAGIIGFATAVQNFNCPDITILHDYLCTHLPTGCQINGINNNPYLTNILLPKVFGETVRNALSSKNIYVGLGSACSSHAKDNRTLAAMKFTPQQQKQVLRISFGMQNTLADVQTFLQELTAVLQMISR